ncbi:FG-GAP-like repeat-containing protein [Streptomyces sp. NPDC054863]
MSGAAWTSAEAEKFWTPARMEAATAPPGSPGTPAGPVPANATRTPEEKSAARKQPRSGGPQLFGPGADIDHVGSPAVGMLYFVDAALSTHSCTASVVQSPKKNLIVTAAHCGTGSKVAFVPQYRSAQPASTQPHGIWAIERAFRDNRHTKFGPGSDVDFAFATVKPNKTGQQIQDITGGNRLTRTPGYANWVTVMGYPNSGDAPADKAIKCYTKTTRLAGYKQMRLDCGGFYGGTSGSPFLMNYDEKTKTGDLVGNLGGWNGGGLLSNDDSVSFSPIYDNEVFDLYDAAINNREPTKKPPFTSGLGEGELWTHARQMASGDYTGDGKADLIVVWTDGEITLYRGDGLGGFVGETQLQAKDDSWDNAVTITGGDFTGSNLYDLLVRWSDGRVTLYADVSPTAKLGNATQLMGANSTWPHADQIIAGRFANNQWVDDLVVRWSDGEVSLFSDVSTSVKFSKETKLKAPNTTWPHATLLTSGDFTGNDNWDLLVRWTDGERTLYPDLSPTGFGKEVQMQVPNALWAHAHVMTAGNYNGNGHPDDLIVRWSDGELTMYTDTGTALGAEHTLVPPKAK